MPDAELTRLILAVLLQVPFTFRLGFVVRDGRQWLLGSLFLAAGSAAAAIAAGLSGSLLVGVGAALAAVFVLAHARFRAVRPAPAAAASQPVPVPPAAVPSAPRSRPAAARQPAPDRHGLCQRGAIGCRPHRGAPAPQALAQARAGGFRFLDQDVYQEHFQKNGIRLELKSNVGKYSIEALDLNRRALRRLRDIRERLTQCDQLVAQGVLGLRTFPLDQLPPSIKGSAWRARRSAERLENQLVDDIDSLLRDHARSSLVDRDPDAEARAQERAAELKQMEALHPGSWRAPRKGRTSRRRR